MKPMKLGDPTVKLWVFTRSDVATIGDAVLDALTEDPDLAPQKFGLWDPYKADVEQAKSLWRSEAAKPFGSLYGERKRPFEVSFLAVFGIVPKRAFHYISWSSPPTVLRKVAINRIEALFHRLIAASNPYLGIGYHSDDFERQNVYRNFRHEDGSTSLYRVVGIHPERFLPGLYWLNYFGPEPTASMPALAKGACGAVPHGKGSLLKLADDPRQMTTPESIERIEHCKRKLGEHRFFVKNPELEEDGKAIELRDKVVVHHSVEQQALTRYPGVLTEAEKHSLENLRGIPKATNPSLHLSAIRREWNRFYRENPAPSRDQLLRHAAQIDEQFGDGFLPPTNGKK